MVYGKCKSAFYNHFIQLLEEKKNKSEDKFNS